MARPAELAPLGGTFGELYDRRAAALAGQPGFVALTFGGSIRRGHATPSAISTSSLR